MQLSLYANKCKILLNHQFSSPEKLTNESSCETNGIIVKLKRT